MMRTTTICLHGKRFKGQDREKEKLEAHAALLSCKSMRRDEIRVVTPPGRSWRTVTEPGKAQMDTAPSLGSPQAVAKIKTSALYQTELYMS